MALKRMTAARDCIHRLLKFISLLEELHSPNNGKQYIYTHIFVTPNTAKQPRKIPFMRQQPLSNYKAKKYPNSLSFHYATELAVSLHTSHCPPGKPLTSSTIYTILAESQNSKKSHGNPANVVCSSEIPKIVEKCSQDLAQ